MFLRNYYNAMVDYGVKNADSSTNMNVYKAYAKDAESPPTNVSLPVGNSNRLEKLLCIFPKGTKELASLNGSTNAELFRGVIFGTGTKEPTLDDYQMSGDHFVDYTASYTLTDDIDDLGVTYTCIYTLTSTASEDVTISEIGLTVPAYKRVASYYMYYGFLIERTLLETPITISPGGVGQITYTLRINYPTI